MNTLRLYPPSEIKYENAPVPVPTSAQLLIKVHATALTRSELTWAETLRRVHPIPGHDICGTVLRAPADSKFKAGAKVFALISFSRDGAAATYALATEKELAIKPKNLSTCEAAAIPLSALTAWQAFENYAKVDRTMKVLVTGASGGVGVMGVQIAKLRGALVVGTCGKKNATFVKSLGADGIIDYSVKNWEASLKDPHKQVDVVLDCVGGETLQKCLGSGIVREGGVVVSIAQPANVEWEELEEAKMRGIKSIFFVVKPDGAMLEQIRTEVEKGTIVPVVGKMMKLEEGAEAFEILEEGHVRGKIVLMIDT